MGKCLYTKESLISKIRDYVREHKEPPRNGKWPTGFVSYTTINKIFGSYNNLLIASGFREFIYKPRPTEECIKRSIDSNKKRAHGSRWAGGRVVLGRYIGIWNRVTGWYDPEHRLVMEKIIGRKLRDKEVVHHLNYNSHDNRPDNLYLCRNEKEHKSKFHSGGNYHKKTPHGRNKATKE